MKIAKSFAIGFIVLLSLLSAPAFADRTPRPGTADPRIKSYTYHENEVYYLKGHYGFTTVVEFSSKEKVESIAIGDSEAWQIQPGNRRNLLYIKPLEQNAETNMTVLTSRRIYSFELTAEVATSPKSNDLTFRVRFRYPDEESLELANFGGPSTGKYDPLQGADLSAWNFDYSYAGDKRLRPKRVFDDGTFTYFEFSKSGVMPAVFTVDEHGNENLVNFNTEGTYLIVNSVGQQFTLREGDSATCIFNDAVPQQTGKQARPVPIATLHEKTRDTAPDQKIASAAPLPARKPEIANGQEQQQSRVPGIFPSLRGQDTITLNN